MNFQMFKLDLKTAKELDQIAAFAGSKRKQGNSRKNIYLCYIDYGKAFDCVDHNRLESS